MNKNVASTFRQTAKHYGGRLGLCASAAFLLFLESDPAVQKQFISRVQESELTDQMEAMLETIREEQARRVAAREGHPKQEKKK